MCTCRAHCDTGHRSGRENVSKRQPRYSHCLSTLHSAQRHSTHSTTSNRLLASKYTINTLQEDIATKCGRKHDRRSPAPMSRARV